MVPPETPKSIKYILGNEVFKVNKIVLLISSYFCCCNFDYVATTFTTNSENADCEQK